MSSAINAVINYTQELKEEADSLMKKEYETASANILNEMISMKLKRIADDIEKLIEENV